MNLLGYNVYRIDETQTELGQQAINSTPISGTEYFDKTFQFGKDYSYIVRAVSLGTGGAQVLELRQVPLSWPRGGQDVLVRLQAASLNPADIYFRTYGPYIRNAVPILGHDGAGVVEEVGRGVTRIRAGDRVCFCNGGIGGDPGTYAEFAVVPEEQLVVVPDNVDWIAAAALPLVPSARATTRPRSRTCPSPRPWSAPAAERDAEQMP